MYFGLFHRIVFPRELIINGEKSLTLPFQCWCVLLNAFSLPYEMSLLFIQKEQRTRRWSTHMESTASYTKPLSIRELIFEAELSQKLSYKGKEMISYYKNQVTLNPCTIIEFVRCFKINIKEISFSPIPLYRWLSVKNRITLSTQTCSIKTSL